MSKKVLVIGLAKSGLAAIKLLQKHNYDVVLTTNNILSDEERLNLNNVEIFDGGHPLELLNQDFEFVVKNPGIPYTVSFIKEACQKFEVITEIELGYRFRHEDDIILSLTGTNGKTTTVTLIYDILKAGLDNVYCGGNIGTPLCDLINDHDYQKTIILEISNFQLLGTSSFNSHITSILNLSPDHLDYMNSVEEYYESKLKIYANQSNLDYYICNLDDDLLNDYLEKYKPKSKIITYSLNKDSDIYIKDNYIYYFNEKIICLNDIKIQGQHNLMNIMCAIAYSKLMNVDNNIINNVISNFNGVEYRLQEVYQTSDLRFYNDSKSTTPDSTITAINAINDDNVVLILGGKKKGLDFSGLKAVLDTKACYKTIYVYGELKDDLKLVFNNYNVIVLDNLTDVINDIKNNNIKGSILFSPASSSYDQYPNYEKRGLHFNTLIKEVF